MDREDRRLVTLTVNAWGPFANASLVLDRPLTLVVGANGVGKSYLRDAVTFALIGRCRGVRTKRDLGAVVVRDGSATARVELALPTLLIERTVSAATGNQTLTVTERASGEVWTGTPSEMQERLLDRMRLDEARAAAALDSWRFLALSPDERRAMLFAAVGGGTTDAKAVEKALITRGLAGGDEPARLSELAARDGFRAAEASAVEMRRAAKRRLDAVPTVDLDAARWFRLPDGSDPVDLASTSAEAMEKRLADLRTERDSALVATAVVVERSKSVASGLRDRMNEALAVCAADRPDVASAEADMRTADAAFAEASQRHAECETEANRLRARVAELKCIDEAEPPAACQAIPGGFPCPAKRSAVKRHVESLCTAGDERLGDLTMMLGMSEEELGALSLCMRDSATSAKSAGSAVAAAKKALAAWDVAKINAERMAAELAHAESVVADYERAGTERPKSAPTVAALDARISCGTRLVRARRDYDAAVEVSARAAVQRVEIDREIETADTLAKAFAPSGIESDLLREALAAITDRLPAVGCSVGRVAIGADLSLTVEIDGATRSEAQLSRSQSYRLGVAMQDAIAAASGLPLLVVDETDLCVQESRSALLGALLGVAAANYAAVLAIGATDRTEPTRPQVDAVAMYHVRERGIVEAVR